MHNYWIGYIRQCEKHYINRLHEDEDDEDANDHDSGMHKPSEIPACVIKYALIIKCDGLEGTTKISCEKKL